MAERAREQGTVEGGERNVGQFFEVEMPAVCWEAVMYMALDGEERVVMGRLAKAIGAEVAAKYSYLRWMSGPFDRVRRVLIPSNPCFSVVLPKQDGKFNQGLIEAISYQLTTGFDCLQSALKKYRCVRETLDRVRGPDYPPNVLGDLVHIAEVQFQVDSLLGLDDAGFDSLSGTMAYVTFAAVEHHSANKAFQGIPYQVQITTVAERLWSVDTLTAISTYLADLQDAEAGRFLGALFDPQRRGR